MRTRSLFIISLVGAGLLACSKNHTKPTASLVEPYSEGQGAVGFDISQTDRQSQKWLATYSATGETAKFLIELEPSRDSGDKGVHVSFGKGRFLSEPGSEPEAFLANLAKALEAKKVPKKPKKAASLPFEYAILGTNQARSQDGGFADSATGTWTAMKIFLGDDEGEVFLNFSPQLGKAEFSIKDSDYGDFVVAQLATIL